MTEVVTTGFVEDGKLTIRNREAFRQQLRHLRRGEVLVSIECRRAIRSLEQNAWYWGQIVELLSEHTGYTPDEMHEYLKQRFIPKKLSLKRNNGAILDERVIGGTTTSMNKIEFGEYCESVRRWAAEDLNVVIPDPEPM